jgi:cation diffusion facilitator family transporter
MHRHDHDHDRHHGHDHHEEHGSGPLDWFRHTFAHSHAPHEKVDAALATNDRGIRALKISLVGLGVAALAQVLVVVLSGSTALLADTIHNFADVATSLPLWVAFTLQKRGRSRRFPYGHGRTEDLAGVVIVGVIFLSACVAGYESIKKLVDPQPVTYLWWVVAAALIGFAGNEAVAVFRIRTGEQIGSAALIADGQHSRVDGFTSLAVLVGAIGVALGVPILDPLIGLGITVAILFIVRDAATVVFRRLLDGIEPDILATVERAPTAVDGVVDVHEARARWLGHQVHADLHITVDSAISVAESHAIVDRVRAALAAQLSALGGATIHVCPAPLVTGVAGAPAVAI